MKKILLVTIILFTTVFCELSGAKGLGFDYIKDPRWKGLDSSIKSQVIDAAFDEEVASDPRFASLPDDQKIQMQSVYADEARAYELELYPVAENKQTAKDYEHKENPIATATYYTILQLANLFIGFIISFFISKSSPGIWRNIFGFSVAFFVAWIGGSLLVSIFATSTKVIVATFGRGFLFALVGAAVGTYYGRLKNKDAQKKSSIIIKDSFQENPLEIFSGQQLKKLTRTNESNQALRKKMSLNRNQRNVIIAGISIIVLMGIFPPWVNTFSVNGVYSEESAGYDFIASPPPKKNNCRYGIKIDTSRLLIQWVVAIAASGLGILLTARQPNEQE
ncbi:hypothetical protein [Desulfobacter sp. UBA2225]|uniref:hypothetical protein n=1 Tax=Desulfobacter sp. UBA2225 TaxID=1961413 RepID=UPI00257F6267|nr:hypothetical protein [Desulfobacter sp. UBA2225]